MSDVSENKWAALRAEYISGDITLRKLAEKYSVNPSVVLKKSRDDGWVAKRNQFRIKTESKLAEKLSAMQAADDALKLISLRRSADAMAGVIEKTMQDAQQFNRHIISEGLGGGATQTECRIMDKVDTKAIKDLTGAIKDLTQIMRNLYDLPTIQEKAAMQIASERLNMDKKNADKDTAGSQVTVVFKDQAEDFSG